MIFKGTETNVRNLYNKAWNLNLETISTKCHGTLKVLDLTVEERNYIECILDKSSIEQKRRDPNSRDNTRCSWKIRMKYEEFARWLKKNNNHYLFFDGASKSNPGMAGAGGLICNGNGDVLIEYEWGLGHASNNRAEAFALLQGLLQLQKLGISKAIIIGDSAIIIGLMKNNIKAQSLSLQKIIEQCHTLGQ